MTALSSLLFSCFQAFFAVPFRPAPLFRPPFVTNLLRQPVSNLFQFYAAFSLLSHLISFSVTFSLPYCLIPFSVTFSLPSRLISFSVTFSLPTALFHFCCILASVPPYSRLLFATFSASIILSVYIFLFDHSVPISFIHQKYLFHHQMLL